MKNIFFLFNGVASLLHVTLLAQVNFKDLEQLPLIQKIVEQMNPNVAKQSN